jgi:aspartate dehydrogenase
MYRAARAATRVATDVAREPLKLGLAGLGAVGLTVAQRIEAGIPGLVLAAVSVRDKAKARHNLPQLGTGVPVLPAEGLAEACDVVVECLPPALFRIVAVPALERGRIFVPLSAAEGTIRSVTMITRKPPGGLDGAPYLVQRGISVKNLQEPLKVFDGTAREGARGFPENVNVAAALSLAGIGPDRTRLEIWADPALQRNTHRIAVDADTASFSMSIENVPSENPKTGRIVALSTVAALRGLVAELKVGT